MFTMTDQEQNRLDGIESRLNTVESDLTELKVTVGRVESKLSEILTEFKNFDVRIDTYQKAYQQVVNLAFGLIITAVAAIVIPAVLGK
jgi:archaellum component FlaC